MEAAAQVTPVSKAGLWWGWGITALVVVFMLFNATLHILRPPMVVQISAQLGYPAYLWLPIGIIEMACALLYAFPRTSALGAVLLTGHLGGAVSIHLRVGDPLFSHILFPVYFGVLVWVGLYLRDERLRAFVWRR